MASGDQDATLNLQVVSPSVGVSGPLSFRQLPASTTVKELKARIRDAVSTRPTDENQRLIHQGRLLSRDTETMGEVFGRTAIANTDVRTLHLVLRPTPPSPSTNTASGTRPTESGDAGRPASNADVPPTQPQGLPNLPRPPSLPSLPMQAIQQQILQQHRNHLQNLQEQMVAQRAQMMQHHARLHHHQPGDVNLPNVQSMPPGFYPPVARRPTPPAMPQYQNYMGQYQRDRAMANMHGHDHAQGRGASQTRAQSQPPPGIRHPDHSMSYTREAMGPNGERWHVTINEPTVRLPDQIVPPQPDIARDVSAVLRNGDMAHAWAARQHPPMALPQNVTPAMAAALNPERRGGSAPTTPLPTQLAAPPFMSHWGTSNTDPWNTNTPAPMVYILSSPSGPRALLINNSSYFYTPRHSAPFSGTSTNRTAIPVNGFTPTPTQPRDPPATGAQQAAAPAAAAQQAAAQPQNRAGVVQALPHVWLVIRLLIFVWLLSGEDSSWYRFFMVYGLAIFIFFANTGLLNDALDVVWSPVRQHLENLLPLAGPNPRQDAQAGQGAGTPPNMDRAGQRRDPDPSEAAARLLAQQQQRTNAGWLLTCIRRAEHAVVLFLASLVPGVGERHIAAREAEANIAAVAAAERQRRRAAAAAAADAELQRESPAASEIQSSSAAAARDTSEPAEQPLADGPAAPAAHAAAPLIDV